MKIYKNIYEKYRNGIKQFAILVDPDNVDMDDIYKIAKISEDANVDYIFVGGSLLVHNNLDEVIKNIKDNCNIPVILFPGNTLQVSLHADAILFLSLISGRNPEMLIGKHVEAAPIIKSNNLEAIPTGYMLIDGGRASSVEYMSNTKPIPWDKNGIATSTAMAGELLGLKTIYMDAGSGASRPVSPKMISNVRKAVNLPLIVGGGIDSREKAIITCNAGADIIVVGNAIEKDKSLILDIATSIQEIRAEALE